MAREISITSIRELGDTVRRVRKESGLTQRDAAALCNVSLPFISQVEQGKRTAQIGKVFEVCQRFDVELILWLPDEIGRTGSDATDPVGVGSGLLKNPDLGGIQ